MKFAGLLAIFMEISSGDMRLRRQRRRGPGGLLMFITRDPTPDLICLVWRISPTICLFYCFTDRVPH